MSAWQTRDSLLGTEKVSLTSHASACPAQLWTIPPPVDWGDRPSPVQPRAPWSWEQLGAHEVDLGALEVGFTGLCLIQM